MHKVDMGTYFDHVQELFVATGVHRPSGPSQSKHYEKRQRAKKPGIQQRTQVAAVAPVVNGVGGGVIVLAGPQRTQQLQPQIQQVQYPMQPLVVVAVPQQQQGHQQQVHQQQIQYAQVQSY